MWWDKPGSKKTQFDETKPRIPDEYLREMFGA